MKTTKKLIGLLLVALLLAVSVVPAFAASVYAPVTLDDTTGKFTFTEKLYISDVNGVVPTVTYSFDIDGGIQAYKDGTVPYGDTTSVDVASGKPTITPTVSFDNTDTVETESSKKVVNKTVEVDLSGITFTEPGVFFWAVNKTKDVDDAQLTNNREKFFIVVRVNDDNGELKVVSKGIAHVNADGDQPVTTEKADHIQDEYAGTTHDLSFEKVVAGNQGSHSRYFEFKLTIENASIIKGTDVAVNTTNGAGTPADVLYGEDASYVNPTKITINNEGKGEATFWLKHGENISIADLPDGVTYKLTETAAEGYKSAVDVTGDTFDNKTDDSVTDTSLKSDANVKFTNTKEGTIPTGILTVVAPAAGIILLAALGLAVVIISKRRKSKSAE